jgi:hypothetical protein
LGQFREHDYSQWIKGRQDTKYKNYTDEKKKKMFFFYYVFRNMSLNYIDNNGIDLNVERLLGVIKVYCCK